MLSIYCLLFLFEFRVNRINNEKYQNEQSNLQQPHHTMYVYISSTKKKKKKLYQCSSREERKINRQKKWFKTYSSSSIYITNPSKHLSSVPRDYKLYWPFQRFHMLSRVFQSLIAAVYIVGKREVCIVNDILDTSIAQYGVSYSINVLLWENLVFEVLAMIFICFIWKVKKKVFFFHFISSVMKSI